MIAQCFLVSAFCDLSKKNPCLPQGHGETPMLPYSGRFIVLTFIFRSMMYLKLIFVHDDREIGLFPLTQLLSPGDLELIVLVESCRCPRPLSYQKKKCSHKHPWGIYGRLQDGAHQRLHLYLLLSCLPQIIQRTGFFSACVIPYVIPCFWKLQSFFFFHSCPTYPSSPCSNAISFMKPMRIYLSYILTILTFHVHIVNYLISICKLWIKIKINFNLFSL